MFAAIARCIPDRQLQNPDGLESPSYRRKTNMKTLRCMALVSLGIAFCIGCGDSSTQSWEAASPSRLGRRRAPKVDDTADNDERATAGEPDNPHKMMNPHGGMTAWRMPMPAATAEAGEHRQARHRNGPFHRAEIVDSQGPQLDVCRPNSPSPRPKATKTDGRLTVSQAGGTAGRQHRPLEEAVRREAGQGKQGDHRCRRDQDHAR